MINFLKKILHLGLGKEITPVPLDLLNDNLIGHYFRNKVSGEFIYIYSAVTFVSFEPINLDIIDRINNLSDEQLEADIRKSRPIGDTDPDSFHVAPRTCMPSLERTHIIECYDHCDLKKIFAPESTIEDWHAGLQQFKYIVDICINNFRRRRDEIKNRIINEMSNQAQTRLNSAFNNLSVSNLSDGLQSAARQVRNRNNYIAVDPAVSGSTITSTTTIGSTTLNDLIRWNEEVTNLYGPPRRDRPAIVPPPDPEPADPIAEIMKEFESPFKSPEEIKLDEELDEELNNNRFDKID